jgi:ABC-type glycerol-3-phosphate transport system substrate-binding protein
MRIRLLVLALVAAAAGTAASGLTASNTVPSSVAGSGAGGISGYVVSAISYTLNATTPTNVDAVVFTLDAAAGTVKAKLTTAGNTFYACTNVGFVWTCPTTSPQATVSAIDQLTVVAVG